MTHPYRNAADVGYSHDDFSRFDILRGINFASILDIGSGPCLLLSWLHGQRRDVRYHAYDLRDESLELCDCTVHQELPVGICFDAVCLFGVSDYCAPDSQFRAKQDFRNLLMKASSLASRYMVFTVTRDFRASRIMSGRNGSSTIHYGYGELLALARLVSSFSCSVSCTADGSEYAAVCRMS